eukprot:gnl/MRDRNA2_/MRDRNA2_44604_c0_seq1.p1 gnl/MRDRNA2_/MRDRNA2_44604_c0~~gnl/MRDRNA2_/MRDRNA2_44604_c0_seq1.p1  ORF type:complete len:255 (+),score=39.81 gnl/MRDRNA2_/MRDRNA2_44604_c0_seq1:49-813(+)
MHTALEAPVEQAQTLTHGPHGDAAPLLPGRSGSQPGRQEPVNQSIQRVAGSAAAVCLLSVGVAVFVVAWEVTAAIAYDAIGYSGGTIGHLLGFGVAFAIIIFCWAPFLAFAWEMWALLCGFFLGWACGSFVALLSGAAALFVGTAMLPPWCVENLREAINEWPQASSWARAFERGQDSSGLMVLSFFVQVPIGIKICACSSLRLHAAEVVRLSLPATLLYSMIFAYFGNKAHQMADTMKIHGFSSAMGMAFTWH